MEIFCATLSQHDHNEKIDIWTH